MPHRVRAHRPGFTLLELLVAVVVFGIVGALTMSITVVQERGASAVLAGTRASRTATEALELVTGELRGSSAADLVAVTDTSLDLYVVVAEGVVCGRPDARLVALPPLGRAGEGVRTRWRTTPRDGDLALFLDPDTVGALAWRDAAITSVSASHDPALCPASEGYAAGTAGEPRLLLELAGTPAGVGEGTVVRVQRRIRMVLYRAGDGSGQLGFRPCPAAPAAPCDAVQPAAGPLLGPARDPARGGLQFTLRDSAAAELDPAELGRAALVHVVARAPLARVAGGSARAEGWIALRAAGAR